MSEYSAAHAADTEYFVRRGMTKGYEYASLLTPPLYTVFVFSRRGRGARFTINQFLRATWIGGVVGGSFEFNPLFRVLIIHRYCGWRRV
jgi:hypothetical protein